MIERRIDADQLDSAFVLAEEVARRTPEDSALIPLWRILAQTQTFFSEPPGAVVTRAALDDTSEWVHVGVTPTPPTRIPTDAWFYRYTLPGYRTVTVMGARLGGSYVPIPSPIPLRRVTDPDSDMVLLRAGRLTGTLFGLAPGDTLRGTDGNPVVWGPDSRRLYYADSEGLHVIELQTAPSLSVTKRRIIGRFPVVTDYDLSPNGRTFIVVNPIRSASDVVVVVNWADEARRAWSAAKDNKSR